MYDGARLRVGRDGARAYDTGSTLPWCGAARRGCGYPLKIGRSGAHCGRFVRLACAGTSVQTANWQCAA
eukprot:6202867-Pleurochrysis_carterae.AAC.6